MKCNFDEAATCKVWDSYFAEVDRLTAPMGRDGRELRDDLERHLLEDLDRDAGRFSSPHQLRDALDRLGRPVDILGPALAESYLSQGTQSYNPVSISKGLFYTLLSGGGRMMAGLAFVIGYMFIIALAAIAIAKPFWDEHVGVFLYPDGTVAAGFVAHSVAGEELLGWWSIESRSLLDACRFV